MPVLDILANRLTITFDSLGLNGANGHDENTEVRSEEKIISNIMEQLQSSKNFNILTVFKTRPIWPFYKTCLKVSTFFEISKINEFTNSIGKIG